MTTLEIEVPGVGELGHGQAKTFRYTQGGELREGFVLRLGAELVAFRNRCPHWGTDLDMGTGEFWSDRLERIFCRTHGALFRPDSGLCDGGPCPGMYLERFKVAARGESCLVQIPGDDGASGAR